MEEAVEAIALCRKCVENLDSDALHKDRFWRAAGTVEEAVEVLRAQVCGRRASARACMCARIQMNHTVLTSFVA